MGMFLTKYSMLNALGYGTDEQVVIETKRILNRFKLFGLILFDPVNHNDFNTIFTNTFERLDFLTGQDFLFFGLTDPPKNWLHRNNRDYFGIWEVDKLLSPANAYVTDNESISAYTIAQKLGIDYDDLPVIILTNNFRFNQYSVIKTCAYHLEHQLTEIGYFCAQKREFFNLSRDPEFNGLINRIDLCGGRQHINNEESLARILSDFLAFLVANNRNSQDYKKAEKQIENVLKMYLLEKEKYAEIENNLIIDNEHIYSNKIDKVELSILGCLSNLIQNQKEENIIEIDGRCENESKIIIKTFNKVLPHFEPLRRQYSTDTYYEGTFDYSFLIIGLCKIFEIEISLSIVHWIRNKLNIEMPEYFKKLKKDNNRYMLTPAPYLVQNPRPIDFNKGNRDKWITPGIGESELITKTLHAKNENPPDITNLNFLFEHWSTIAQYRNRAAHTETLTQNDFNIVFNAFKNLIDSGKLLEMNTLKMRYKI